MNTIRKYETDEIIYTKSNIIKTNYRIKRINQLKQRIFGVMLLLISFLVMYSVNEITAAFITVPISLFLIFTKEQIMQFSSGSSPDGMTINNQ